MTSRLFAAAALVAGLVFTAGGLGTAAEEKKDKKALEATKKALAEIGDFIGQWNVDAKGKIAGAEKSAKEKMELGWKFKDGDGWVNLDIKDGKFVTKGELKYDPAKKDYLLTLTDAGGKELGTYAGKLKVGKLILEKTDSGSGDIGKITMYTVSDGARLILVNELKAGGKGSFVEQFKFTCSKEGESFAGGKKKPECVVTGGAATMAVNYGGKTYYVCCSGCRDEFNANPKKFVDEFEKKNK
jgi:YHS domain-containing protein